MSSNQVWQLFVDESGDFDDPEAEVAVAGVLVRAYDSAQLRIRLRQALERAVPVGLYPPHTNRLNIPAWIALASMVHVAEGESGARFRKAADPAIRAIEASAEAPAVQAREAVRAYRESGKEVSWEVGRAVDAWLAEAHPHAHRRLACVSRDIDAALVQLLERLQSGVLDGGRCFVSCAWSGPEDLGSEDRYLRLLEVLLERVFALSAGPRPPEQRIFAHVATRRVRAGHDGAGGDEREKMRVEHLAAVARPATTFPVGCNPPHVVFFPHPPAKYDASVHPGIVLADIAANRLLGRVLVASSGWEQVQSFAAAAVGLPVDASVRALDTSRAGSIAASGAPRDAIRSAFRGEPHETTWPQAPRWAGDQARVWTSVAARLRRQGWFEVPR